MQLRQLQQRGHLPALDGLRAITVLLVMVSHYFEVTGGRLGVNGFFTLSGFLITWLLLIEHRQHGTISLPAFFMRRVFRIFPAYYAYLLLIFTIEWLQGTDNVLSFLLPSFLYYFNYFVALTNERMPEIQHLWSLSVEEQFYLLWPPVLLLLIRLRPKQLISCVVAAIGAVVLWRSYAWLGLGYEEKYIYRAFDTRFDSILIGCLLALAIDTPRLRLWLEAASRSAWLALPAVAAIVVSVAVTETNPDYGYCLGFTVDGVLFAWVLLICVQHSDHALLRWLDMRWICFIGAISYPAYLYHELGAGLADRVIHRSMQLVDIALPQSAAVTLSATVATAATFALAYCSYRYVEQPMMRLRRRLEAPGKHPEGLPPAQA